MLVKITHANTHLGWGATNPKTNKLDPKFERCFDVFTPGISAKAKALNTGLTKELEAKFETELSLKPGDLAKWSPYWDNFSIRIPNDGLELDTDIPSENLFYHVLKADPGVATSVQGITKLGVQYLMISEENVAKESNGKREIIAKAWAKFSTMTDSEIRDALFVYGKNYTETNMEVCKNTLGNFIEENPKKFLELVVLDEDFAQTVFINKLIAAGIIVKRTASRGKSQPLYFNDVHLGNEIKEVVNFIKDKENSNILIALQKQYKADKA